ncbi:MAG: LysR family transcriptional regulator [Eubacterium sp.]|nr:LysR family transcriptional regulator [Eubacterium sp.]
MAQLDDFQVFKTVAEQKSISKAAKILYLTQPTITRTIQRLESELNATLFLRSKQGVSMTKEGELLFEHVTIACNHIDIAKDKLSRLSSLSTGILNIGVTEMTMQYYLLPYLVELKKDYPNINIHLSFEYPDTILYKLNSGFIDLAFLTTPLELDDTVQCTPVFHFHDILIAGPNYFSLTNKRQHLSDLTKFPFILMEHNTSARAYIESFFAKHHVTIKPEFSLSSMPLIVPMVIRNLGLAFIPSVYVQKEYFRDDVRRIFLFEEMPKRSICVLSSNIYPHSAACEELLNRIYE